MKGAGRYPQYPRRQTAKGVPSFFNTPLSLEY